jgi:hypothetical protein
MVSNTQMGWSLHPQLEADTVPVGGLALSRVLLERLPAGASFQRGVYFSASG